QNSDDALPACRKGSSTSIQRNGEGERPRRPFGSRLIRRNNNIANRNTGFTQSRQLGNVLRQPCFHFFLARCSVYAVLSSFNNPSGRVDRQLVFFIDKCSLSDAINTIRRCPRPLRKRIEQ